MKNDAEALYKRWIDLYDAGDPDAAMALTAPNFAMIEPQGSKLDRAAAQVMTQQMKQYFTQLGMARKTQILSLHVVPITDDHAAVHAQVELALSKPDGTVAKLRFAEVIHVGPEGITFDSFARLSETQGLA